MTFKFVATPEAQRAVIQAMAEEGFLDLKITRIHEDSFCIELCKDSVPMMTAGDVRIRAGDSFTLSDVKIKLELEGVASYD